MNSLFSLMACSVCFGDPNSLQSRALFFGVCFLVGVVAFVLAGIASTAMTWARRAKKLGNGV